MKKFLLVLLIISQTLMASTDSLDVQIKKSELHRNRAVTVLAWTSAIVLSILFTCGIPASITLVNSTKK